MFRESCLNSEWPDGKAHHPRASQSLELWRSKTVESYGSASTRAPLPGRRWEAAEQAGDYRIWRNWLMHPKGFPSFTRFSPRPAFRIFSRNTVAVLGHEYTHLLARSVRFGNALHPVTSF